MTQYRFSVIVQELKNSGTEEYKAAVLALINCIINSPESIKERMNLRNEFIGLGVMDSIAASRESECEVLQTQMAVWEESKAGDQDDLEAIGGIDLHDPDDAFKMLLAKVSSTPRSSCFLLLLQKLILLEDGDGPKDAIWEAIHAFISAAVTLKTQTEIDMLAVVHENKLQEKACLLYTSPSPRDRQKSRMPSSA